MQEVCAVTIYLYKISCDPHTLDKSPYVDQAYTATVQGTVRGDLDVLAPDILMQADASGYNYAYIPELNRYYHIVGINRERTALCRVALRVDVLWTYAEQIKELPAVVRRSYRLVNSYLPDDQLKTVQYVRTVNKNIGGSLDYIINPGDGTLGTAHILVTVG